MDPTRPTTYSKTDRPTWTDANGHFVQSIGCPFVAIDFYFSFVLLDC